MDYSDVRIVFAGDTDYANCANRVALAINSYTGFRCARVVLNVKHRLGYKQDLYTSSGGAKKAISHLRSGSRRLTLTTGDGSYRLAKSISTDTGCPIGSLHVGTPYREESSRFDGKDKAEGSIIRFISPDSVYLTDMDCLPYLHCVDNVRERSIYKCTTPIVFHSPTSSSKKGTSLILSAVEDAIKRVAPKSFKYRVISGVSYERCTNQRRSGHVFIDQLNTRIGGFGYSSVEAASEGLVPVASMNNSPGTIWSSVGLDEPPILGVVDKMSLSDLLCSLMSDSDLLYKKRVEAYEWATRGSVSMFKAGKYYVEQICKVI